MLNQKGDSMKIGIIGLGKMGLMLARNLRDHQIDVIGYDVNEAIKKSVSDITITESIDDLLLNLDTPRIVWMMLPAGQPTDDMVNILTSRLSTGDILIDGGNSHFKDSISHFEESAKKSIHFLDVGTSGGIDGARNGACMMIGGEEAVFKSIEPLFNAINVESGYMYCGPAGSGHYLKMIHNGIEYGMMQSIAEGFNVLYHSDYDYDLESVARVFSNGSVIRGWLMELTEKLLSVDSTLDEIEGVVFASGEGSWTVSEALRLQVPIPVITQSLFARYTSQDSDKYGEKLLASLRNQFGGHSVQKKE